MKHLGYSVQKREIYLDIVVLTTTTSGGGRVLKPSLLKTNKQTLTLVH